MQLNPFTFFQKKDISLSDPRLVEIFGNAPTASGVAVNPHTALRVPAFNAAVRAIAETVATLPLSLFKRGADGVKEKDYDNPLYRLLHDEPNEWTSSFELRLQMGIDAMLHGNAYGYVNRVGGEAKEIVRLPHSVVTVKAPDSIGPPEYELSEASGKRKIPYSDIIHIKALSYDGVCGLSPVQLGREAIALALALEETHASLHANGAQPGGVLSVKGKLDSAGKEKLKSQWQAFQGGVRNKFKTAVLDVDADWKSLGMTGVDSQHLETRRFQIEEISRLTRVPPHLLSELGRATWGNASEMGQSFLDYCLLPWLMQWQGALTRALLKPEDRKNSFIEFDTSALVRANLQARSEAYYRAVGGPYLLANEVRAIENRPPIDDGNTLNKPTKLGIAANDNNNEGSAAA